MKTFVQTYKKLHIWLLADCAALLAYFLLRGQRWLMNALADHVTGPFRRGLGKLCYLVPFSVMEVVEALAVAAATGYVIWSVVAVIRALAVEDAEFVTVAPHFPEYRPFVECNGGKLVVVPADVEAFQIRFDELEKRLNAHTQAVIINSPNNPSGVIYTGETLRRLAELLTRKSGEAGHPIYLIADEPYRELVYGQDEVPFVPTVYKNTIVCYSYSKSLSLPGERIGYVCVPDEAEDSEQVFAAVAGAARSIGHVCPPSLLQRVVTRCAHLRPDIEAYDRNRTFYNTMSPSMDILISSNLERMIFELSGRNDRLVREYMAQLSEYGSYRVDSAIRTKLKRLFSAGCCDDSQTLLMIGRMWKEKEYLLDPHTAVAFHVLDEYRAETGDDAPTVVVSTASPFKFCSSVLTALGVKGHKPGVEILDQLSQYTGVPVPMPLARLKNKQRRFSGSIQPAGMMDCVLDFLK